LSQLKIGPVTESAQPNWKTLCDGPYNLLFFQNDFINIKNYESAGVDHVVNDQSAALLASKGKHG
jgi:hypothetical protein